MDDHEKDRYGVSWGQEKQREESTKSYLSFNLEGTTYSVKDTVYLLGSDGPPYIANILDLYENVKTREKCMLVRWFVRPCELPLRTAGVNFKEDCKEIFMMWGRGSKNVVNPAAALGKCNVVCTALLDWNLPRPSEELTARADHIFSFAFDVGKLQLVSLNLVVKRFGEFYVTGVRVRRDIVKKESGISLRKAVKSGIETAARVTDSDRPRLQPVGRASDGPSEMRKSNGGNLSKAMELVLKPVASVTGSDRRGPQLAGSASDSPALSSKNNEGTVRKAVEMSDLIAEARKKKPRFDSSGPKSEPGILERYKVSASSQSGLSGRQKIVPQVRVSNVSSSIGGIGLVESELKAKRMQDPRRAPALPVSPIYKSNATPNVVAVELGDNELTGKQLDSERSVRLLGAQKFFKMPWHNALQIALEKRRALLLQNLDPWFASSEIEGMLTELLGVSCEARMLPPKDFSSYTSGEALVLFRNQSEAENAYAKFTENVLIWSEDQRPVVASLARKQGYEISRFHGFLNLAKFNPTNAEHQQGTRGATSQCSQPNTVVFEMGMQWRLLQEQHREAWNLAAKVSRAREWLNTRSLESGRRDPSMLSLKNRQKMVQGTYFQADFM